MLMKHTYKALESEYTFSIVIPVYNAEQYLEECIASIIQQEEIKFETNTQIILINDGSTDKSQEIIDKYKKMYPHNIQSIFQHNQGVSKARNQGIQYASGKYINFLDADDMISSNTLINVRRFFEEYIDINIVSIPIYFFEGKNEAHILNNKFKDQNIIDINKAYDSIQMSISGTFIKRQLIEKCLFKEELKYGEDAYLITQLILEEERYGIVQEAKYLYRYRASLESTMQGSWKDKKWFLEGIDKFSLDLLMWGKQSYHILPKYLQYVIVYDLSWKVSIGSRAKGTLTDKEWQIYFSKLVNILSEIDNDVILKYRRINKKCTVLLLLIKYCKIQWLKQLMTKVVWGT